MGSISKKVLFIEDCASDVFLLEQMLENTGHDHISIHTVARLIDAFKCLQHTSFDLILLDLNLEDMDGVESVLVLKAEFPQTPILVYSGQENARIKLNTYLSGAFGYLVKGRETGETIGRAIMNAPTSHVGAVRELQS